MGAGGIVFDIRHLRYFVAVADSGSFVRASERLHISQPALSVRVSSLEAELGVQLMERSRKGVKLTREGEALYLRAVDLIKHYQDTVNYLRSGQDAHPETVSIGMPSTTSSLIGPELYRRTAQEIPNVRLYITDAGTASLYEWLVDCRIDFAILFGLPFEADLAATPLHYEEFCFVSRADEGDHTQTITFEDVFTRDLVLTCQSTTWRKVIDNLAEKAGRKLDPLLETESINLTKAIVAEGLASTLLPMSYANHVGFDDRFVVRKLVEPSVKGVISLVNLSTRQLGPAHIAVRDLIADIVRSDPNFDPVNGDSGQVDLPRTLPTEVIPPHSRKKTSPIGG